MTEVLQDVKYIENTQDCVKVT